MSIIANKQNLFRKIGELKKSVSYIQKKNKGNGYAYVSSTDVLSAVRNQMDELGLMLITEIQDKRVIPQSYKTTDHYGVTKLVTTYFTELDIKYTWVDIESGESHEIIWYGQGVDPHEKGVGKALTYAEKYFFLKQFNIPTDEADPDSYQQISNEQKQELLNLIDQYADLANLTREDVLINLRINNLDDLTVAAYFNYRQMIQNMLATSGQNLSSQQNIQSGLVVGGETLQVVPQKTTQATKITTEQAKEIHNIIKQIATYTGKSQQEIYKHLDPQIQFATQADFPKLKQTVLRWLEKSKKSKQEPIENSAKEAQVHEDTNVVDEIQEIKEEIINLSDEIATRTNREINQILKYAEVPDFDKATVEDLQKSLKKLKLFVKDTKNVATSEVKTEPEENESNEIINGIIAKKIDDISMIGEPQVRIELQDGEPIYAKSKEIIKNIDLLQEGQKIQAIVEREGLIPYIKKIQVVM